MYQGLRMVVGPSLDRVQPVALGGRFHAIPEHGGGVRQPEMHIAMIS
jgi:hypothetical protein